MLTVRSIYPKWLEQLRPRIGRDFGPKCKDFEYACAACMAWMALEILESLYYEETKKTPRP